MGRGFDTELKFTILFYFRKLGCFLRIKENQIDFETVEKPTKVQRFIGQ